MDAEQVLTGVMISALEQNGGFTLDARTGEPVKQGIAVGLGRVGWVCITAAGDDVLEQAIGRMFDANAIPVERMAAMIETTERERVIAWGGWRDDAGVTHLEPALVFPASMRERAIDFARSHGEEAVFDLGAGETIWCDGRVG